MRILYLHQYFARPDQSGGTRSYDLAVKLAEAGHDVQMITTSRDPSDSDSTDWYEESVGGITVHWLPIPYNNKMNFYQRLSAFLKFAWKSGQKAVELKGDVVFATSTPLTIAIPGVKASRKLKVPMVFEVRDLWPELPIALGILRNPVVKYLARKLERYAYSNAAEIIALSPGMAEGVCRTGYPKDKVTMIPNFSNNSLFGNAESNRPELEKKFPGLAGRAIVLYAGTLGAVNNVDYFIEAIASLKNEPDTPALLVVGDGMNKSKLTLLAEQLNVLDSDVFFHPPVPKKEMPSVITASTICAIALIDIPEINASSPNKLFDALAAGRPVVVNHRLWLGELAQEHKAGLVLPSDDPAKGAQMLIEFLGDKERVAAAGKIATQLAHTQFDRDQLAQKLLGVLTRVTSANSAQTKN